MDGGDFTQNCVDGSNRTDGCVDLVRAVIACVVDTAAASCEDTRAFWLATYGSGRLEPPTDESMPCYAEVTASWDAGCDWPPY